MAHRLKTTLGKLLYKLRKQTVEPVFGIIKEVMGFRHFSLRGQAKVSLEWTLVCVSYNLKRLFTLKNLADAASICSPNLPRPEKTGRCRGRTVSGGFVSGPRRHKIIF
jgi:hypothetical protein